MKLWQYLKILVTVISLALSLQMTLKIQTGVSYDAMLMMIVPFQNDTSQEKQCSTYTIYRTSICIFSFAVQNLKHLLLSYSFAAQH